LRGSVRLTAIDKDGKEIIVFAERYGRFAVHNVLSCEPADQHFRVTHIASGYGVPAPEDVDYRLSLDLAVAFAQELEAQGSIWDGDVPTIRKVKRGDFATPAFEKAVARLKVPA